MKKMIARTILLGVVAISFQRCNKEDLSSAASTTASTSTSTTLTAVAQTSGQLASGTSFKIDGSTTDSTSQPGRPGPGGHQMDHHGGPPLLDGTNFLAPDNRLLTIIDAESAGDIRGIHMHANGGAAITNYDASGAVITLPAITGPQGCSFSGGQFPQSDSLLAKVAKTVIDYGTGVTEKHDTVTITRIGKIIITRTKDATTETETTSFENYSVNGNAIAGTKTRTSSLIKVDDTAVGSSATTVTGGKITFSDGTTTTWTSDMGRKSTLTLDTNGRPVSGDITTTGATIITATDGTVIYSHKITKSIIENVACGRDHYGPVSGTVETVYNSNTITLDFGDGNCANNSVTLDINGVATTKTVHP